MNEQLTEEEREAISYILAVRNQKQELLAGRIKNTRIKEFVE
jgi:hypothetical protein